MGSGNVSARFKCWKLFKSDELAGFTPTLFVQSTFRDLSRVFGINPANLSDRSNIIDLNPAETLPRPCRNPAKPIRDALRQKVTCG